MEESEIRKETEETESISKIGTFINQGNTAEIYQYEEGKILKLFRKAMPYQSIQHEYRMALSIQEKVSFVPRAYQMLKYEERYGIVYEQIKGTDMIQMILKNVWKTQEYCQQLADIHVQMHRQEVDVHESVKKKLSRDINAVKDLSAEETEKIKKYLNGLPDGNKLCHFDFHPGNVLLRGREPIVIDWMTACTGDPASDVARTTLLMKKGEVMHISPFLQILLKIIMKMVGSTYFAIYQKETGMKEEDINKWLLPVAAARLSEWLTEHERKVLVALVRKELQGYSNQDNKGIQSNRKEAERLAITMEQREKD